MSRTERVDRVAWISLKALSPTLARLAPRLEPAAASFMLTATYLLLEWMSAIHEYKGVPITPWNPGLGVVLAIMILRGIGYSAILFVGSLVAEVAVLRSELAWPIIVGIAAIVAVGYGLVAAVVRARLHLDAGLNRLRDILVLLGSATAGALLVAVSLSILLLADAALDAADVLVASVPLLIGDIIGIAVVTPMVLRLALRERPWFDRAALLRAPEFLLFTAMVMVALWAIVGTAGPHGPKLFYVLFLPVVAAAIRHGLDGACIGLAITQLSLIGMLHNYGYDAHVFTEFQLLMLVLSATGLTVGVVVTEREHADAAVRGVELKLKAKEAEAAQAGRLNLVSGMTAALAHEINQPLAAARALGRSVQQMLRTPGTDLGRADANLTKLITQIDHAGGVIRHLRDFLRRGRPHPGRVDIRALLTDALALAGANAAMKNIDMVLEVDPDVPGIRGDAVQLPQVVLNLVRNAAEAIGDGTRAGRVMVTARAFTSPPRIEISVIDNGPGIGRDIAARLFQPLTTSKPEGLGLGLSISASIVEAHGGRIWLQASEPGTTEFRFVLPAENR